MASAEDWRIRIDVVDVHDTALERLGVELDDEARELARDLEQKRLAVSRDGDEVFVYASTRAEAEQARAVIEAQLRSFGHEAHATRIEHWLEDEERWDDEPKGETWEEEELGHGHAPWEVRVTVPSRKEAHALAAELESEGYHPLRRFQYLIVGAASKEDAEALAKRLHGQVEGGGEVVDEVSPGNPFSIFGGLGA